MKYVSAAAYNPRVPRSKAFATATALGRVAKEIMDKELDVSSMTVEFIEEDFPQNFYVYVIFEVEEKK